MSLSALPEPAEPVNLALPDAPPPAVFPGFDRAPYQVFFLTLATLGLYAHYWLLRNRRLAERRLEERAMPPLEYLFLIVPIWGFIIFCQSAKVIERRVRSVDVFPRVSFVWQTSILLLILYVANRFHFFPATVGIVLAAALVASMQVSLNRAECRDFQDLPNRWLKWWEILLLVVGLPLFGLAVVGEALGP